MTGGCEDGTLEVLSPDAGVTVRTGEVVPALARVLHDGGTTSIRVPLTTDFDGTMQNIVYPLAAAVQAPASAGTARFIFGWAGGPNEVRTVEVVGCNAVQCADWQSCTPTRQGGLRVTAVTALVWLSPDGGTYGPSAVLPLAVQATLADAGVYDGGVPVVGPGGSTVLLTGAGPVKTGSAQTPAMQGVFTWRTAFDGGVNGTGTGVVDATGPTFTFVVPDAGAGFKRDELVRVQVQASEALASAPQVLLAGSDAGVRLVTTGGPCAGGSCPAGNRCDCVELDVSVPAMASVTGGFALGATGVDVYGNSGGTAGPVLSVTRRRWQVPLSQLGALTSVTEPAMDTAGNVYVGFSSGIAGQVTQVRPDGGIGWVQTGYGTVTAPVVWSRVWIGC